MAVLMTLSTAMWSSTIVQIKSSRESINRAQLIHLAEAGLDKAVYELNESSSFTGETNVSLGSGTYTTVVSNIDSTTKLVTSTAYIPNNVSPTDQITVKMRVGIDSTVIAFNYGVQAGTGGFVLNGGSTINGNVYSNGTISATTGVHINGSAVAANPPSLAADQSNETPATISSCTSSNCINFGNATATEDFAQSFQLSADIPLNNVQFYIRKVSTPGNATVRITTDNAGSPSTTTLLSGTLSASSVTTTFGWVSVAMPATPVLNNNQTYWLVIDGSSNASRYYTIGANSNGYANGQGKIGRYSSTWSNTTPTGLDGYIRVYTGGGYSMIGGNTYNTGVYVGNAVAHEAWAHTVQGATMSGPLYCATSSYTNKACNTSRSDPPSQNMPLSDNNIQDWKDDATAGGTQTGDVTIGWAGGSLGPKKIVGNLTVNGGGTLTVNGTLWITGNLTLTGGGTIRLASSYGSDSGALVIDGVTTLNGGSNFAGSGTSGSYPFVISTSACPVGPSCGGANAITLSGGAGTVALVAQEGTVDISGGTSLKAVTAKQITMTGGASLIYDSGLISENFYSGPGGSWAPIAGSYIIIES